MLNKRSAVTYETVAASQTTQVLGASGAVGDYLERLIITVSTSATSTVQIKDGSNTAVTIVPANHTTLTCLSIEVGAVSTSGAWQITTGAGASVIAIGAFS